MLQLTSYIESKFINISNNKITWRQVSLSGGTFWFGTQTETIAEGKLMAANPKDGADLRKVVKVK